MELVARYPRSTTTSILYRLPPSPFLAPAHRRVLLSISLPCPSNGPPRTDFAIPQTSFAFERPRDWPELEFSGHQVGSRRGTSAEPLCPPLRPVHVRVHGCTRGCVREHEGRTEETERDWNRVERITREPNDASETDGQESDRRCIECKDGRARASNFSPNFLLQTTGIRMSFNSSCLGLSPSDSNTPRGYCERAEGPTTIRECTLRRGECGGEKRV